MSCEIIIHKVYMPTLTLLFMITMAPIWGLDQIFASFDLYRFTRHPVLFQVSLSACLYGGLPLTIYR